MLSFFKRKLKGVPWEIICVTYAIIILGLVNLYSSTNADLAPGRFYDQLSFIMIGTLSIFFFGLILELRELERLSIPGYLIVCALLLAVAIFGDSAKGAVRWLALGPVRIQPSEFAKFLIIIIIAKSFSHIKGYREFNLLNLWQQFIYVGILFSLIIIQPDLGTACIVLLIFLLQLAVLRINLKSILIISCTSIVLSILAWNFVLHGYQKKRILTFLDPMLDPRGAGYNSLQSMIAVGNGGFWGYGFGHGPQAQLNFLPERHTDFAFSVWAEEHGFVGCAILIVLFVYLIFKIFQLADKTRDTFSALVIIGVGAFFLFHFLINISMALGIFPIVGVPLSFISYGGTHMVTSLSCIGLIVAVERKRRLSHLLSHAS